MDAARHETDSAGRYCLYFDFLKMAQYRVGSDMSEKGSAMGVTVEPKRSFDNQLDDKKQFRQSLRYSTESG